VPSGSDDAPAFADAVRSDADTVNEAVGAWFGGGAVTVTFRCSVAVAPWLSVTVSVTGKVPPAA
jgi:hypothetical protein